MKPLIGSMRVKNITMDGFLTHRRLLLFKWFMIFIPSGTVAVGLSLLTSVGGSEHASSGMHGVPATLLVTLLGLALSYLFVETLFRGLWRLQAQVVAREQDIQRISAVMQERERLSRELHDGAAQLVAHLLLRLDTIKELVEANRSQEAEAELERLHGVADEIYQDIEESIAGLRTNLMQQGLVHALQDYVDQFEERHLIKTSLRTDDAAEGLSPQTSLQLFRFIQEALTNVRKHAQAHQVTVTLISNGSGLLKVVIADDGQGFFPGSQRNGKARPLGLKSMRERITSLGGTFSVASESGEGTQVSATIPMAPGRRENGNAAPATPAG
jgi:signal transduction histidine kinase